MVNICEHLRMETFLSIYPICQHLGVSIVMGVPLVIIHFNGIFPYEPSSYYGVPPI